MPCFYPHALLLLLLLVGGLLSLQVNAAAARSRPLIKVQGFVFCDSCLENRLSNTSLPIPGATITLTCKSTLKHHSTSTHFTRKASSDKYGVFSFALPFSKPRLLRRCKVELTSSPFEACIKHTPYSSKVLSPILSFKSKEKGHLAYSSGWLSYQPNFLPSFCISSQEVLTKNGHHGDQSKDETILPQGFSFPSFFPPFPGTSTPSFPFDFFPPMPTIPGTATPGPFSFPPIPGFPPFPDFFPFPNFPFQNFPFPFPFPFQGFPNPFATFPPFPGLGAPPLPLNPLSPSTPTNPFPNPTPSPIQLPPLPPGLPIPPLPPNSLFPSPPTNPLPPGLPIPPLPPIPFSPTLQFPPLPPIPFSPSLQFPPLPPLFPSPPTNPLPLGLPIPPLPPIPFSPSLQFPPLPPIPFSPRLQFPPLPPNSLFPSPPTNTLPPGLPIPPLPPIPFSPSLQFPPFSPIPLSPSNPTNPPLFISPPFFNPFTSPPSPPTMSKELTQHP